MTSLSKEPDDSDLLTELEARIRFTGEVQINLAAAERALETGMERPEPYLIRALTLLANRVEREDGEL